MNGEPNRSFGRGHPKGSKNPRRSSGLSAGPNPAERLRMDIVDLLARTLPVAFRIVEDQAMKRIEDNLDRLIRDALDEAVGSSCAKARTPRTSTRTMQNKEE